MKQLLNTVKQALVQAYVPTRIATIHVARLTVTSGAATVVAGAVQTNKAAHVIAERSSALTNRLSAWVANRAAQMDQRNLDKGF